MVPTLSLAHRTHARTRLVRADRTGRHPPENIRDLEHRRQSRCDAQDTSRTLRLSGPEPLCINHCEPTLLLEPAIAITTCITMARHPAMLSFSPLLQAASSHELLLPLRPTSTAGGQPQCGPSMRAPSRLHLLIALEEMREWMPYEMSFTL